MRWGLHLTAIVLFAGVGCMGAKVKPYQPPLVRALDNDSDKVMQVVSHERFPDHEPEEVTPSFVRSAMLASGFFQDDDAESLAPLIAEEIPHMVAREHLRIVGWANDALRIYYLYVHDDELHIDYYKRGERYARHESRVPDEPVEMPASPRAQPEEEPDGDQPDGEKIVAREEGKAERPAKEQGRTETGGREAEGGRDEEPGVRTGKREAGTGDKRGEEARPKRAARSGELRRRRRPIRLRQAEPVERISEDEARRKLRDLDRALRAGLITKTEHKQKKKEILARL